MQAILCAILAGLCWGVGEIFTKSAINTREIGPLGAVLVRAAVTLPLALVGFLIAREVMHTEPQVWRDVRTATWLKLILGSGVLAGFGGVFFFYLGLSLPGGEISRLRPIAFALAPATAVLLGWWFLGEAMTVRKGAAVVLIVVGIVMLAGRHSTVKTPDPIPTSQIDRLVRWFKAGNAEVPSDLQPFLAVLVVDGSVGNGGWASVYYNRRGDRVSLAIKGYREIGALTHAENAKQAMEAVERAESGRPANRHRDEEWYSVTLMNLIGERVWADLDREWSAASEETDVRQLLETYLQKRSPVPLPPSSRTAPAPPPP